MPSTLIRAAIWNAWTTVLAAAGADFAVMEPSELRVHVRRIGELFVRSSGGMASDTAGA
jgi:hypothetical protein